MVDTIAYLNLGENVHVNIPFEIPKSHDRLNSPKFVIVTRVFSLFHRAF
jgi:hypothetical protein